MSLTIIANLLRVATIFLNEWELKETHDSDFGIGERHNHAVF